MDLTGRDVLVVGAGKVGKRKIAGLVKALPRSIIVVDPALDANTVEKLEASGPVVCRARGFMAEDLERKCLVFAATDQPEINAAVASLCAEKTIPCNSIDAPESGSFIVPAHFTCDGITVALSTGGGSPALAKVLREELEAFVGKRYTLLLAVLARLRPRLLNLGFSTEDNTVLFRALVHSPLAGQLEALDYDAATATLKDLLPEQMHSCVRELLHGF